MTYKTYTKKFIRNFNFSNPNWENLPNGFPNLGKQGLTRQEGCLLDAIKLAWMTGELEGRKSLLLNTTRVFLLVSAIVVIGTLGLQLLRSPENTFTTVNAATIKVDDVIQSTMSAILKR
ncbi:hypothetical protein A2715_02670 [Candidatus Woesebacteria bacterium RIFCSPHIGHO2_01_FULL_39_32]|uniref:Uncharacterized protein n=1 Tax=Candidatus Woesebacteria bacterium RIFCSPLOWO2_01_FULL_39_25 TaxID=1802521 RepID=A0A1F8BKB9_9BACT|nr:MAG: hypothetical protein A2715_02670 [Candidatus Woesebacteria bacterium RIFCSPHIGHO2_01_FULL_39_32]OGM38901.1 MAG: hypothetical protein A3F01_02420 [Candidatus Woesebacteria bacterium RIFCSPHIGHO2_12_FULL_38_11]OGM64400.1 MAG: hypothetical protein A2893_00845 [Candidatus Woesebacteria bacterium RIFCSPLOWO2_01_FULL_39_25]